MSLARPAAWHPGDRVAVVSPASPFPRDAFDRGCAELQRLGFIPVFDDDVFAQEAFLSGSAEVRANAVGRALADPTVTGLMAVRGGYGSVHILPSLDALTWRAAGKAFVGYSDLTSLLSWITCQAGMVAIHGPMLSGRFSEGPAAYDPDVFLGIVGEPRAFGALPIADAITLHPGEASGPLYGGTLTQLCASLGTPFAFDPPAGSVLFIEDVNERPYRLDRMLTQLMYAGVIARARAVVFGEMLDCDEPGGPTAVETIARVSQAWGVPVISNVSSGHTRKPSLTLPLGVAVRVVASPTPALEILEPAVR